MQSLSDEIKEFVIMQKEECEGDVVARTRAEILDSLGQGGDRVPGLDRFAFVFLIPNSGGPASVKCVTSYEEMQGGKGFLILPPNGLFMFRHTCAELLTDLTHEKTGTTQRSSVVTVG